DAARRARQPRVEHHPLAALEPGHVAAEILDRADHLVAEHLRERDERRHRAVVGAFEVHQHLLGVRPADAGEVRPDHRPVGAEEAGVGHVLQRHGRRGEMADQPWRVVGGLWWHRIGELAEEQRFHVTPIAASAWWTSGWSNTDAIRARSVPPSAAWQPTMADATRSIVSGGLTCMSPAMSAAAMTPSLSSATPARHSFLPLWLPNPTRVPAGAPARNRSDEIRRTMSSLPMRAPILSRPCRSPSVSSLGSRSMPACPSALVSASRNSS